MRSASAAGLLLLKRILLAEISTVGPAPQGQQGAGGAAAHRRGVHVSLLPHQQLQAAFFGVAVRAEGTGVCPSIAGALALHTDAPFKLTGPCGSQIVLNTGFFFFDMGYNVIYIYGAIYVECVLKNPAYTPGRAFRRAPAHPCPLRPAQQRRCSRCQLSTRAPRAA